MSALTKYLCDGCGADLEAYQQPYTIKVERRHAAPALGIAYIAGASAEKHACSAECFGAVLDDLRPKQAGRDEAVRKGTYR